MKKSVIKRVLLQGLILILPLLFISCASDTVNTELETNETQENEVHETVSGEDNIEPEVDWVTVSSYQVFCEMKKLLNETDEELITQRLDEYDTGSGVLYDKADIEQLFEAIEDREVLYLASEVASNWTIGSIRYVVDTGFFDIIYSNGTDKLRIGCGVLEQDNEIQTRPDWAQAEDVHVVQVSGYDMEFYPLTGEEEEYRRIGGGCAKNSMITVSMCYKGEDKEKPLDESVLNALRIATIGEICDQYEQISNSVHQEKNQIESDISLEELLMNSTHVVLAEYNADYEGIDDNVAGFVPIEVLRGDVEDSTILLRSRASDNEEFLSYQHGAMYILILDKMVSVYEDRDYYLYTSIKENCSIPYELGAIESKIQECEGLADNKKYDKEVYSAYKIFASYIRDFSERNPHDKGYIGEEYIKSDKLDEIVEQTDLILKVRVTEHWDVGSKKDREMCFATVTETLKGDVIEGQIQMILFKNTVETGEEYIVMLDKPETANFYIPSSRNSIFPVNDIANVSEIYKCLDGAN